METIRVVFILTTYLLLLHCSILENKTMTGVIKLLQDSFINLFQGHANAKISLIPMPATDVVVLPLKSNFSTPTHTSSMLPNTSFQSIRRNRSLLANLVQMWCDDIDRPIADKDKPKKCNKFLFRSICVNFQIINEKHYQNCLKDNADLQDNAKLA